MLGFIKKAIKTITINTFILNIYEIGLIVFMRL